VHENKRCVAVCRDPNRKACVGCHSRGVSRAQVKEYSTLRMPASKRVKLGTSSPVFAMNLGGNVTRTPFSPLTRAFSTQNHTIPKHEKIMQKFLFTWNIRWPLFGGWGSSQSCEHYNLADDHQTWFQDSHSARTEELLQTAVHSKVLHPSCSHTTIYITLYSLIGPSNPSFPARPRTCRLQHQLCAMVQLHENGKRVQRSRTDCLFEIRPLCLFPSEPPLLHAHQNRQPCTILMLPFEPRHTHDYPYCAIQSQSLWHMGTLSPRLSLDFFFLSQASHHLPHQHPPAPAVHHTQTARKREIRNWTLLQVAVSRQRRLANPRRPKNGPTSRSAFCSIRRQLVQDTPIKGHKDNQNVIDHRSSSLAIKTSVTVASSKFCPFSFSPFCRAVHCSARN
jgi:hypothetical protein